MISLAEFEEWLVSCEDLAVEVILERKARRIAALLRDVELFVCLFVFLYLSGIREWWK